LVIVAACALSLAAGPRDGHAHQQTTTFGVVSRAGDGSGDLVSWRLRVRAADLGVALHLPPRTLDAHAPVEWRGRAQSYLGTGMHVFAGSRPCAAGSPTLADDPTATEPTVVFVQPFACARDGRPLRLRYDLFFEADRFHESFTLLASPAGAVPGRSGAPASIVFRDGLREATIGPPGSSDDVSLWASARLYLGLGVVHILTGYDHLSFLMALLLAAGLRQRTGAGRQAVPASAREAVRGIVGVVSAFTVAHSLTLITQVLSPGWMATRWVEPIIAFSVAFVGFDNLVRRPPRFRLPLVFGFGLVHGLGFASVLREIGLPRTGLVLSLVSFNLGVEVGQLAVLSLVFPVIVAAAHRSPRRFERWGLELGSGLIAAFGTIWLVARLAVR
jgi:HupE / UreJ protein